MEIVMLNDQEASNVIGGGGCVPDHCVPADCAPNYCEPECDKHVWKIALPKPRIPKISLCFTYSNCYKPKWGKGHNTCD